MNDKVMISFKKKILGLIITLLLSSVGSFFFFAQELFLEDKTAYIYETGVSRAQSISNRIDDLVKQSLSYTLSLAFMNNTHPEKVERFLDINDSIVVFSTLNDLNEENRFINEGLLLDLSNLFDVDKKKLESIDMNKVRSKAIKEKVPFPTTNELGFPSMALVLHNQITKEKYLTVISLTKIWDAISNDKVYKNLVVDNMGNSYMDGSKSREVEILKILKSNFEVGNSEITLSDNKEKLIGFVKSKKRNYNILTDISKKKAFNVTKTLRDKSLSFGLVLVGLSIFLGLIFSVSMTKPIHKLLEGTKNVAKGVYNKKIDVTTRDELSVLAKSFNFMSDEISSLIDSKQGVIDELEEAKVKLEDYNKNLESMVEQRTMELKKANDFLDTMINSLGQGLMVLGKDFKFGDVYTRVCEKMFGLSPVNKTMANVLDVTNEKELVGLNKWIDMVFKEVLPFDALVELGPSHYVKGDGIEDSSYKFISLEYFPMRDEKGEIGNLITVATDTTEEQKAKFRFQEQQDYVEMMMKIVNNKSHFYNFIHEFNTLIKTLEQEISKYDGFEADKAMMVLHSIKGTSSLYSISKIADKSHFLETEILERKNEHGSLISYLPKLKEDISGMKDTFEEVLSSCAMFLGEGFGKEEKNVEIKKSCLNTFEILLSGSDLTRIREYYEDNFLKVPIGEFFRPYNLLVQELSVQLNKSINDLELVGGDLRIKPDVYDEFISMLVHLFRNSVDHGIESEDERTSLGKSKSGNIQVEFQVVKNEHESQLHITIRDDGKGINPDIIREKLTSLNPGENYDEVSDEEIVYHIFDTNFSTAETITDLSGRGVGMSAIKEVLDELNGTIFLSSTVGKGSEFKFSLPLV